MRIGVRGCCGVVAARCPAPSFNAMKKKTKIKSPPQAPIFFNLAFLQTKTSATRGPRGDGPRAPPRPRDAAGLPPGGPLGAPPRGTTRPRGPPRPGPGGPPPPGPEERRKKKTKKKKKKKKINATTFACPEAANTRTT